MKKYQSGLHGRSLRRFAVLVLLTAVIGCQREWYREQADEEVACLINEKSYGNWDINYQGVDPDPRSRYFDPYDPVRPPMPEDDPDSHQFMQLVDGKEGWDGWFENGSISDLENPDWKVQLASYADVDEDGVIHLTLEDAIRIGSINSPTYQQQIEEVYLSALDVSTERFRFDTQFFGGTAPAFSANGSETRFGATSGLGVASDIGFRRQLATAGQLTVDAINSLSFGYSGGDTYAGLSSLSFSFLQPLLRFGGRQVAMETLTIAERTLLANMRAYQHYRQGYYTGIAIGNSGTSSPRRRGGFLGSSGLSGFTGQGVGGFGGVGSQGFVGGIFGGGGGGDGAAASGAGFAGGGAGTVGGFIGLLQTRQQIRNTETSLRAQQQALELLEAYVEASLIEMAQVDQFRQNIETERANLLQAKNSYVGGLEAFTSGSLGLPPDTPVLLDESLIDRFRFQAPEVDQLQVVLASIVQDFGDLPIDASVQELGEILTRQESLVTGIDGEWARVQAEVQSLVSSESGRLRMQSPDQRDEFRSEITRLSANLTNLAERFAAATALITDTQSQLRDDTREETANRIITVNVELTNLLSELSLIQTRARTEAITLETVELSPDQALEIARANRFDWMNNRAALVDAWRLIEFNANRLESSLDIELSGQMNTLDDNNVAGFRAENGSVAARLEFDAPLARRIERNNFRQQLISYQRQKRSMIRYEDGINQGLRRRLRTLAQHEVNLEIQRRAVVIAIRRVDQTREDLNKPAPAPQPGQPPAQLGPTAATNLLTALSDLRNTQNNFMSVWLNYYADRMQLMRDLGIMRLDENGVWIDESIEDALAAASGDYSLPPDVPGEWLDAADGGAVIDEPLPLPEPAEAAPAADEKAPKVAPLLPPPGEAAAGRVKPRTHLVALAKPEDTETRLVSIELPEPLSGESDVPAEVAPRPSSSERPVTRTAAPGAAAEVAPRGTRSSRPGPRRLPHVTVVPRPASKWKASTK